MRKAIHQISAPYPSQEDAGDSLAAVDQPRMRETLGLEAAWVCPENRVHMIVTKVTGLDALTREGLALGQRIVWLPCAARRAP